MKKIFIISIGFLFSQNSFSQQTDKKLFKKISEATMGFNGDIGIYIKNLRTGKTVAINADTVFQTASIVKVPIMVGVIHKLYSGSSAMTHYSLIKIHYCMLVQMF